MLRGDEVYGPKNSLNDYFVNFTVYLCSSPDLMLEDLIDLRLRSYGRCRPS